MDKSNESCYFHENHEAIITKSWRKPQYNGPKLQTIGPALETLVNVATTRNQETDVPTIFITESKAIFYN